jgi:hypothetical protein
MKINVSVEWELAPAAGRFEFVNAQYVGGNINIGWGNFSQSDYKFSFTSTTELCRIFFALEVDDATYEKKIPLVKVIETEKPFTVSVVDVLKSSDGILRIAGVGVTVTAEIDVWGNL